jgi:hypothetical protein
MAEKRSLGGLLIQKATSSEGLLLLTLAILTALLFMFKGYHFSGGFSMRH